MITPVFRLIRTLSNKVADAAGHPATQLAVLVLCLLWWAEDGSETVLASTVLSGGFVLTQKILNQQRRRELA